MSTDPKGYYVVLGVGQTASEDEIKTIYRALAKIYHPDVNSSKAAAEKFRRITEAYEVLSDSAKRRNYDALVRSEPMPSGGNAATTGEKTQRQNGGTQSKAPIAPIPCSVCGRVTAQPRFLVFKKVISFVVLTRVTPTAGVFCSECAKKVAVRSSAISAAFGWWGFPWGPIYTISTIFSNAFGGERRREADEELTWHNVVAFLGQGKHELAGSLALGLANAKREKIASASKGLIGDLRLAGLQPSQLKSPWQLNLGTVLTQIALGAVVPALAFLLFSGALTSGGRAGTTYIPSPVSSTNSGQSGVALNRNQCRLPPRNGTILSGSSNLSNEGHKLTIRNGSTSDAIIKLRDYAGGQVVTSFFVAKGKNASVDGIRDGDYRVQFAYGDAMFANCRSFVSPDASEFQGVQSFRTETTATQIITQELTFTLYFVAGGNVRPVGIGAAAFDED